MCKFVKDLSAWTYESFPLNHSSDISSLNINFQMISPVKYQHFKWYPQESTI